MNIEQKSLDALNAELTIRLEPADYNEKFEKALKEYRKRAQLPGFRPGHIPVSLIKQRFGKSLLAEEINRVLQDAIYQYIGEKKLNILGNPLPINSDEEVGNWDEPGEFNFKYEVGIAPEFELKLTKSESFDYFKVDVDSTLIDRQVKDLARRYGKLSEPELSEGEDMIMCTLEEVNTSGEVVDGGVNSTTTITVEYVTDSATQKQLIGLKKGDTVVVNPMHLTANHEDLSKMLGITHDALHHFSNSVRVTVNELKRMAPHDLNTELFDKLFGEGEVKTEEEMRSRVKADLEKMFARDSDWMFKRAFIAEIVKRVNPELPDAFLRRWIMMTNEKPVTADQIEAEYPSYAGGLRWQLIENKIILDNEIKVTVDDAKAHVKSLLAQQWAQYGLPTDDEMLEEYAKKTLADREQAKNVYDSLYEDQIIALVKSNCTINEQLMSYEEFVNKAQHQ